MIITRRAFFGRAGMGAITAGFAARAQALDLPFGCQLHAVRTRAAADFPGTLAAIAALGYREVELVSFRGYASAATRDGFGPLAPLAPSSIRNTIRDAGLTANSAHFKFEEFQESTFADRVQWARGVGLQYMTVSDLPPQPTLEGWKRVFDALNTIGARVRTEGLRLGLHTQNDLWREVGGVRVMDALLTAVDTERCQVQLDLSTTQSMQIDATEFLRGYAKRCFSVHLRDAPTPAKPGGYVNAIALGDGDLDLPDILRAARAGGISSYIVEMQVAPPADPMEALRRSAAYLRALAL